MNLITLYQNLGITESMPEYEQLPLLKTWFETNVSRDISFEGDHATQLKFYSEILGLFLEEFLPKIDDFNSKIEEENIIFAAASLGFDQLILTLKPNKDILNLQNANGMTPLQVAALEGHYYTVETLMSLGADTSLLSKKQQLPIYFSLVLPVLYDATYKHNKEKIYRLLRDKGIQNLTYQNPDGETILHQMAAHDFADLIEETIKLTPELSFIKNKHTRYPIHTSILNGHLKNVALLLQVKDADQLKDSEGWTALHYAARFSEDEILQLCCEMSSDLNVPDYAGRTPLMLAAELGRLPTVKMLIANGARIDLTDGQGWTVFHHAVQSKNLELVSWLLKHTMVDINATDVQQKTPLKLSELGRDEQMTSLLLSNGAAILPPTK